MGSGNFRRRVVYRYSWNVFVITCLIVLACGREKGPREPQVGTKPVTLALWGAAWCTTCKSTFPAIQAEMDKLTEAQRALIGVQLYVPTGANPARPATQEDADSYRDLLGIKATSAPDPWMGTPDCRRCWTKFTELVGGEQDLPGAALLNAEGKAIKIFRPGSTTFVPSEIIATAVQSTL